METFRKGKKILRRRESSRRRIIKNKSIKRTLKKDSRKKRLIMKRGGGPNPPRSPPTVPGHRGSLTAEKSRLMYTTNYEKSKRTGCDLIDIKLFTRMIERYNDVRRDKYTVDGIIYTADRHGRVFDSKEAKVGILSEDKRKINFFESPTHDKKEKKHFLSKEIVTAEYDGYDIEPFNVVIEGSTSNKGELIVKHIDKLVLMKDTNLHNMKPTYQVGEIVIANPSTKTPFNVIITGVSNNTKKLKVVSPKLKGGEDTEWNISALGKMTPTYFIREIVTAYPHGKTPFNVIITGVSNDTKKLKVVSPNLKGGKEDTDWNISALKKMDFPYQVGESVTANPSTKNPFKATITGVTNNRGKLKIAYGKTTDQPWNISALSRI